jgi:cytochrome c-type biogenesis protein
LSAPILGGIQSIVLSPCHLASVPLIVGFIREQGQVPARRAFWTAALFAVGIPITIAAIGTVTAAPGRIMGDVGRHGNYFVALIFFLVGLHLVGVIPMPWSEPATLLSVNDSIAQDNLGPKTAAQLGKHVAEVALRLPAKSP